MQLAILGGKGMLGSDLADAARPALLAPGDSLRFAPVSGDEFERLAADEASATSWDDGQNKNRPLTALRE